MEPKSWAVAVPAQVFPLGPSLPVMSSGSGEGWREVRPGSCQHPWGPPLWRNGPAQAASREGLWGAGQTSSGWVQLSYVGCCKESEAMQT